MTGIARSASLFASIATACAETHKIDVDLADRFRKTFVEVGIQRFGEETFRPALERELKRRETEVQETGARRWCEAQRARYKDLGPGGPFKD